MSSVYMGMGSMGTLTFSHRHRVSGTVLVEGSPEKRVVAIFSRKSLTLLAATYSDEITGKWEITGLPEYPINEIIVIALDNTGVRNSLVLDYISQG